MRSIAVFLSGVGWGVLLILLAQAMLAANIVGAVLCLMTIATVATILVYFIQPGPQRKPKLDELVGFTVIITDTYRFSIRGTLGYKGGVYHVSNDKHDWVMFPAEDGKVLHVDSRGPTIMVDMPKAAWERSKHNVSR